MVLHRFTVDNLKFSELIQGLKEKEGRQRVSLGSSKLLHRNWERQGFLLLSGGPHLLGQSLSLCRCHRWAKSRWASRHAARYITGGPGLRSLWKRKKKWHTAVDRDVIELFLLSALTPWCSVSEPVCLFKSRTKIDHDETALQGRSLVHFVGWPTSPLRRQWRSTRLPVSVGERQVDKGEWIQC